jgi:hypothetical protein
MTLIVEHIVAAGLCIGRGLYRAIAGPDRLEIAMTCRAGSDPACAGRWMERSNASTRSVGAQVDGAVGGAQSKDAATDLIWGPAERLAIGYARQPANANAQNSVYIRANPTSVG